MSDITLTQAELQEKINAAVAAETAGLTKKRDELLAASKELKKQIDQIEADKKDAEKKAEEDKLASEGKWEELVTKLKDDHKEELENLRSSVTALQEKNTQLDGTLRKNLVDQDRKNW